MVTEQASGMPSGNPHGRVLVLLDGSRMSYVALKAAADIARRTGAEILGVFVEESNLLRSAGYGFAREVGAASGISRPFSTDKVEERMVRMADQARKALAEAMSGQGSRHGLSIARGRVIDEVLTLTAPDDILVLGRTGWSSGVGRPIGSTALGLIRRSPSRVLLWCERPVSDRNRIVVFLNDHEQANHRAMLAAAESARHLHQPVTVILPGDAGLTNERLERIKQDLDVLGAGTRLRQLTVCDPSTVARVLHEEKASELVMSRECSLFRKPGMEDLVASLNLPVTVTP
ncbi:universal stress protein [Marinobacter salinexigens]|uniref:Universal stress protein n=1 Tax=Marinobacter salinexigens TaxID=2919747 RepID=A0A5B0VHC1_9GAMM|nr:universal stress protein [Marinobacter salinexigens]KAA1173784.1 universal stress protein [Marinobacter salinexigens]